MQYSDKKYLSYLQHIYNNRMFFEITMYLLFQMVCSCIVSMLMFAFSMVCLF